MSSVCSDGFVSIATDAINKHQHFVTLAMLYTCVLIIYTLKYLFHHLIYKLTLNKHFVRYH